MLQVFLGSLRDIEQEMIRERLSSAVMESLLALTIFREEFSAFFVTMFATLVFIKVTWQAVRSPGQGGGKGGREGQGRSMLARAAGEWRPMHPAACPQSAGRSARSQEARAGGRG